MIKWFSIKAFIPKNKFKGNDYNKILIADSKILSAKVTFNIQTLDSSHGFQIWLDIRITRETWPYPPEILLY